MEVLLTFVLPYLLGLAANERSDAINAKREQALQRALAERSERDMLRDRTHALAG